MAQRLRSLALRNGRERLPIAASLAMQMTFQRDHIDRVDGQDAAQHAADRHGDQQRVDAPAELRPMGIELIHGAVDVRSACLARRVRQWNRCRRRAIDRR